MVLDAEKRRQLVVVAMQKKNAPGPSTPGPSAPSPSIKDKRLKGVAEVTKVAASEDEETYSGLVFKRKRKADAAIPMPSDSDGQAPSYKECSPSTSFPCDIVVQEGRGKVLRRVASGIPLPICLPSFLQKVLQSTRAKERSGSLEEEAEGKGLG